MFHAVESDSFLSEIATDQMMWEESVAIVFSYSLAEVLGCLSPGKMVDVSLFKKFRPDPMVFKIYSRLYAQGSLLMG